MTWLDWLLGVFFGLCALAIFAGMWGAFVPWQYTPMSPDEEVEWLMDQHDMSRDEAEEIANGGQS